MDLDQKQVEEFNANGFVVVPNAISPHSLALARAAFWRMHEKCARGSYKRVRSSIYYPREILGIENIFRPEIFEPDLFAAILESRVLERSQQLLGQDDVFLLVNRLICTVWRSFNGTWHRDLEVGQEHHVQSALSLFPECVFFAIPGSHRMSDAALGLEEQHYVRCRSSLPGEVRVVTPAGGLMLFHSAVVHRGTCAGTGRYIRAQVHFRVAKTQAAAELSRCPLEGFDNPGLQRYATPGWQRALQPDRLSAPRQWVSTSAPVELYGARHMLRKAIHSALYYSTPVTGPLLPRDYPYRRLFVPQAFQALYDELAVP